VESWWAPGEARRRARIQVRLGASGQPAHEPGETALLLVREGGRWLVEGVYD
jgi:hypothetical protein